MSKHGSRKNGAIVTGDIGLGHVGLKCFFIYSNFRAFDFKKDCGLKNLLRRKGILLTDPNLLLITATLHGIIESIGDWMTPTVSAAPRILAPCNVFNTYRFPVPLLYSGQVRMFFTIFPVSRESSVIKKITEELRELLSNGIKDYYFAYGKPDVERWNRTITEIDSEFGTEFKERVDPVETKRICMALEHDLGSYFSKRIG